MVAGLGGSDKTSVTEDGVSGLGDRIRGWTAFGSDKTDMTEDDVSGPGHKNRSRITFARGWWLVGFDKTGMTEEDVSGPGGTLRGKTCGLRTLAWMLYFLAMRGTPCQVVI